MDRGAWQAVLVLRNVFLMIREHPLHLHFIKRLIRNGWRNFMKCIFNIPKGNQMVLVF